ncbi:MAG: nucleotidyltransferase domain-containing protein [Candidatus Thorarchaeota archaeon]
MIQDILERRRRHEVRLRAALDDLVQELARVGAQRIILFGSLVSGQVHEWSDIDLLVVMPPDRSSREWREIIGSHVRRTVACDLLVFTSKELADGLPSSTLLRTIMERGQVLYEV